MLTYSLFFRTSAVLVNSCLVPQLESLTPPSPKRTIFGRHYNSSPLAQTHRHTPAHVHTVAAPLTYFTAQRWTQRAHAQCLRSSRFLGQWDTRATSTALPRALVCVPTEKLSCMEQILCASMFSGCSVLSVLSLTTMDKVVHKCRNT